MMSAIDDLFVRKVCNKYSVVIFLLLQYAPTDWPCRGNLFETKEKKKTFGRTLSTDPGYPTKVNCKRFVDTAKKKRKNVNIRCNGRYP